MAGTDKRVAAVKRVATKAGTPKASAATKGRGAAKSRPAKRSASARSSKARGQAAPQGRCLVLGYDATESGRRAAAWAANELRPSDQLVLVYSDRSLHAPASPLTSAKERATVGRALFNELLLDSPAGAARHRLQDRGEQEGSRDRPDRRRQAPRGRCDRGGRRAPLAAAADARRGHRRAARTLARARDRGAGARQAAPRSRSSPPSGTPSSATRLATSAGRALG